jgi:hypothetical protein
VYVHLIDTPGFPDFAGQAISALAAVDTALVVINAQNGIELSTEKMMQLAAARGVCRMIVINKIDADNVDLPALVGEIRERFGRECMLLDLPVKQGAEVVELLGHDSGESDFESVAAAHRALIDQIVEEDEDLLARYLDEGLDPSLDELHLPFEKALRSGHLIPILFVSAKTGAGIPQLLDALAQLAPSPAEGNPPPFYRGEPGGADGSVPGGPRPGKARSGARLQDRQRSLSLARLAFSAFIRAPSARTRSSSSATASARSRSVTSIACRARNTSKPSHWSLATSVRWPRSTKSNSTACCTIRTKKTTSTSNRSSSRSPCRAWP